MVRRALFCLLLLGCEREHVARYSTRGLLRADVGQGDDRRLAIQHETLDSFEDRDGKRAPMRSMVMVFGLAPPLRTRALAPGSKLHFGFEVRWDEAPFLTITSLEPLPAATFLWLPDSPH